MDQFNRPKTKVQWLLGNSCNYHCSYCLNIFHEGTKPFPQEELFLDICKDIICHYDDLGRDVVFEFIGGEPTLINKIPELGKRLHNYPVNIVLKTNGSAILDWWIESSKYLSEVIISVHKEFCDIEHIKSVVQILQNSNHPISLQVLFPVTNKQESWDWGFRHLGEFRKKYNVGDLQLLYSNFGKGSNMFLPYSESQWEQYNTLYNITDTVPQGPVVFRDQPIFKGKECYAGIDTLTIDFKGNVFRGWCKEGGEIGNIYEGSISWPLTSIICNKDLCANGFDQSARKI